jgi:hypothetical protein
MWWQSVSLGEVEVEGGGSIKVRVDDVESDLAETWVTTTFQGVTLRAIELGGAIAEIQVSPGAFEWVTDVSGNQYRTRPVDEALDEEEWLTINQNSGSDDLWNMRQGLGSYGPILESFPTSGEDAPPLQTSVIFARGGTYDVFFSLGDTGAVDPDENLRTETPLNFAFEGEEFTRWHANDGEFKGTPGYNDYEMAAGQITVGSGETRNFLIDDVQDGTATRSVYLGMRFHLVEAGAAPVPFQVSRIVRVAEGVTLTWASRAGREYSVEYNETLATNGWIELDDGVGSQGEQTSFTDTNQERLAKADGWYRILRN